MSDKIKEIENDDSVVEEDVNEDTVEEDTVEEETKTFTQDEITAIMKRERAKGKSSILKSLGFKNVDDAKKALFKEDEDNSDNDAKLLESNKRAENAENKLACFMYGVNKDSIDDVLAIAKGKITEDNDLDDVLDEMKKNKRYEAFFTEIKEDEPNKRGTGSVKNSKQKKSETINYGKQAADRILNSTNSNAKKTYF